MTLLTWSHECIVGVQAMDDQHGILMDTLNELRLMLQRNADRRNLCLQLERLIGYTEMHFESEERLLKQHGFPGTDSHRAEHRRLIGKLYAALEHVNREEAVNFQTVLDFLPSWYL